MAHLSIRTDLIGTTFARKRVQPAGIRNRNHLGLPAWALTSDRPAPRPRVSPTTRNPVTSCARSEPASA